MKKQNFLLLLICVIEILLFSIHTNGQMLTDIQGNTYKTVQIGNQIWMAENLKVTLFNDSTVIKEAEGGLEWDEQIKDSTPTYCWYNNDYTMYGKIFGALYNWHAVNTGKLCPKEWHVPTDAEWIELEKFLATNGFIYDGNDVYIEHSISSEDITNNKLAKSLADVKLWRPSSKPGTPGNSDFYEYRNVSGFSALPGGSRTVYGIFEDNTTAGVWWTATESNKKLAWTRDMISSFAGTGKFEALKGSANSVRCIKNTID